MILTLILISAMTTGMVRTPAQLSYTTSLTFLFPNLDTYTRNIYTGIQQDWYKLFIDVKDLQLPEAVVLENIVAKGNTKQWDIIALQTTNENKLFPQILDRYSNESRFGNRVYNFDNPKILRSSGVDYDELQQLVTSIHSEFNITKRKELMNTFQKRMMQDWLIELPLFEQTQVYALRNDFVGFENLEGVLGSIFRGAHWDSNPSKRVEKGVGSNVFQTFISNDVGGLNPLLSSNIEIRNLRKNMFPTLFLTDKDGNIHPNLVKQYSNTIDSGESIWDLYLYDNVYWRERNGSYNEKVTSKDIQFTLDLLSKDWSNLSGDLLWDNDFSYEVVDDFHIKLKFKNPSPVDYYSIASQMIVPEHTLNGTLTRTDGGTLGELYSGTFDPISSQEWRDFALFPITSGPYYFAEKIEKDYILKEDPKFHFPNEADTENFNLATPDREESYYFTYNDSSSTSQFEKAESLPITERRFLLTEQPSTMFIQVSEGIGDLVSFYNVKDFSGFASLDEISLRQFTIPGSGVMLVFNLYNPFLQNVDIRKALYYAINRDRIHEVNKLDQNLLNSNINSYYSEYYNDSWGYTYNFTKSKEIFEANNYTVLDSSFSPAPLLLPAMLLSLGAASYWRRKRL